MSKVIQAIGSYRNWGLALLLLSACASNTPRQFRDCANCPEMVELPGGNFQMGTAVADRLTDPRTGKPAINDGPQHRVSIQAFAMGKFEVTVAQYRAFIAATGHKNSDGCMEFSKKDSFTISKTTNWDKPGFDQSDNHPVGCVSYFDALAYADWLRQTTGQPYRVPTEAEWEYAARAGSQTPYFWGTDASRTCNFANVRSPGAFAISKRQAASDRDDGFECDDEATQSSAVGRYQPNAFGLYDMQGNNWEWVTDCNHKDYVGAPVDGSAWIDAQPCRFGLIRGGSYLNRVQRSSTTVRAGRPRSGMATNMGFRVAQGGAETAPIVNAERLPETSMSLNTPGARLFAANCAACHVEPTGLKGVYGTSLAELQRAIAGGGNNVMSMPAFQDRLSSAEIESIAIFLRLKNSWNK